MKRLLASIFFTAVLSLTGPAVFAQDDPPTGGPGDPPGEDPGEPPMLSDIQATLLPAINSESDSLILILSVPPSTSAALEKSSDLENWVEVRELPSGFTPVTIDPSAEGAEVFYRVVSTTTDT